MNVFSQKVFLVDSEVQNSGKVCSDLILSCKLLLSRYSSRTHEWLGNVVNFRIKIEAG